jgi:hypothetical protein
MARKFTFESLYMFGALEAKISMSGLVARVTVAQPALSVHIPLEPDPGPLPPDPPIIFPPLPPS